MRKSLLLTLSLVLVAGLAFSQADRFWSANNQAEQSIPTDKSVARISYPKTFRLFNLNASAFRQQLLAVTGNIGAGIHTLISLPNADGNLEQFDVVEASNFEPDLQAMFPAIRAFSGRGITDKFATLKLSLSPQGVQTMVFRTERDNEFIEPYSQDHSVYSVFRSQREKGKLPWTCSTEEKQMAAGINTNANPNAFVGSSTGQLKTMRLVQSCNGEYANYFGATGPSQVGLVLAAFNATLTRANGCYERDLALHLNLIASSTSVIYYSPAADPYTTLSSWNLQLQQTLTSVIGSNNYDIGHMFGASGGGGNAGCIGCVCVNPANGNSLAKGSGITSPADGIPMGDNFDIDYVVHEVGHQLGANHTFSMSLEGTGQNKEVGSGITIMGYAGITSQDVAAHSIDIYHETSIAQIQANLASKTCPITTDISLNNTAPVIAAPGNYTIPISTPFALTGAATDANGDALTYCWEQNDNSSSSGAASVASAGKTNGPNWLSFSPAISSTRVFPKLSTILAGLFVTPPLPGGDAGTNIEALSSVSRTLNFRLTVRDNHPFSSSAPIAVAQTAFSDVAVIVTSTSGPFQVTSPNTNLSWPAGGTATVTWSVNGTNAGAVNCASVNILLSTDGGFTFPTVLASATPNDGSQIIAVPAVNGTANRIKVEAVGNVFFDISNSNFSIGAAAACGLVTGLNTTAMTQTSATVSWNSLSGANSYDLDYKAATSATWLSAAVATTSLSAVLSNLTGNTLYDWRVRARCSSGDGTYTQSQFTTSGNAAACPGVSDVSTNGTPGGAATITLNTDVYGLINPRSDVDYFMFNITNGGTITITLSNLLQDYQLDLINSNGTVLQSSANTGSSSETINRTVTAGTYYAKVFPRKSNAFSSTNCYVLRVQGGTASRTVNRDIVTNADSRLLLAPNPARNTVHLLFNSQSAGEAVIAILNGTGGVVFTKTVNVSKGANSRSLDVSQLATGFYLVKVQTGMHTETEKLMIRK